ncbi:hypothetical protein HanRHA438_Chr04g0188921 [Helianthus annuus]|nr:hypothetical protein HanRHA438_Chr04g0188921 [Helianthus annuus]
MSLDFLISGSLGSFNSFLTKALIPLSLLYLVKIGTGGIISSLLAAWSFKFTIIYIFYAVHCQYI